MSTFLKNGFFKLNVYCLLNLARMFHNTYCTEIFSEIALNLPIFISFKHLKNFICLSASTKYVKFCFYMSSKALLANCSRKSFVLTFCLDCMKLSKDTNFYVAKKVYAIVSSHYLLSSIRHMFRKMFPSKFCETFRAYYYNWLFRHAYLLYQ